jgi:molybdate transport system substrate-binding protein
MRASRAIGAIAALVLAVAASGAAAAEIRLWTARAMATVLADVGPQFERASGHRVDVYSGLPTDFLKRANAGEPFDLMISGAGPVDAWIRDGRLAAATRTEIARSGIGVQVRAGARKPDISSVDAFKQALLDAKSIGYLRVGSGLHIHSTLERLGISEAVKGKVTRPETDIVSELVAKGEVELGMVVITQILTTPGVELVGPLPPEIQSYVVFIAGISTASKSPEAARDLIRFLTGPVAVPVIKAQGMEPAATR